MGSEVDEINLCTKVCINGLHVSVVSFATDWVRVSVTISYKIVSVNGNACKGDHNGDASYPSKLSHGPCQSQHSCTHHNRYYVGGSSEHVPCNQPSQSSESTYTVQFIE